MWLVGWNDVAAISNPPPAVKARRRQRRNLPTTKPGRGGWWGRYCCAKDSAEERQKNEGTQNRPILGIKPPNEFTRIKKTCKCIVYTILMYDTMLFNAVHDSLESYTERQGIWCRGIC